MSLPKTGDRINNYLLEELVGSGSFGQVWRARHHMFDQVVAIKIPTDLQYVRNLQREGVTVHGLKHANIVRAIDLDPYADPPYFIMELVSGPSLRAVIDAHPKGMPLGAAVEVMRGLLGALDEAHAHNVIHRDVKPANILLDHPLADIRGIGNAAVKVTDFGLGRIGGVTTASIMQSGSMLTEEGKDISGTLAYMSPEQRDGQPIDCRSDLYSCGIILFEMLTGERPAGAELPGSLRSDVPKELDEVFRRSYTRVARRYQSAKEMLAALSPARSTVSRFPGSTGQGSGCKCPSCNSTVHREDQFCIHCGHQLVGDIARCTSCQAYVSRQDRFCIFCGASLSSGVVQ
jgi:serine/threonine-protein kinase